MKIIWLNGRKMISVNVTHHYLKHKLNLPPYYGGNLDALWDTLSTMSEPMQINLLFRDQLETNLGRYGDALIQVFQDAEKSNPNLVFRLMNG